MREEGTGGRGEENRREGRGTGGKRREGGRGREEGIILPYGNKELWQRLYFTCTCILRGYNRYFQIQTLYQ